MNRLVTILCLPLLIFAFSCIRDRDTDDEPQPIITIPENTYYLYFDYTNPSGTNPVISIGDSTSPEVQWDFSRGIDFEQNGVFLDIDFKNIRISSGEDNFEISDVKTEAFRSRGWERDLDYKTSFASLPEMDLVMVLDITESLGDDFDDMKTLSKSFITTITGASPGTAVGVVAFGNEVKIQEIDPNQQLSMNFIDGLRQEQFTKLYEGMNMGVDMLSTSLGKESKVMVTFTDGRDNFSDTSLNSTMIRNKLLIPDGNGVSIQSYVIGLESRSSVDQDVLESLSVNGIAQFPFSLEGLGNAFQTVSDAVGSSFQITYQRNTQPISQTERLRFVIKAKKKVNSLTND
ncbi:MAG: vWA domain-containing protein [Bacteroidota bacterium]